MTSRRSFIASLMGGAAFALDAERALWVRGAKTVAAVDPEKLLWTPGRKLISIPAPAVEVTSGAQLMYMWRAEQRLATAVENRWPSVRISDPELEAYFQIVKRHYDSVFTERA